MVPLMHTWCLSCKLSMCNSSKCVILVPRSSLPFVGSSITFVLDETHWHRINAKVASHVFSLLASVEGTTVCLEIPLQSPPPPGDRRALTREFARGGEGRNSTFLNRRGVTAVAVETCLAPTGRGRPGFAGMARLARGRARQPPARAARAPQAPPAPLGASVPTPRTPRG